MVPNVSALLVLDNRRLSRKLTVDIVQPKQMVHELNPSNIDKKHETK